MILLLVGSHAVTAEKPEEIRWGWTAWYLEECMRGPDDYDFLDDHIWGLWCPEMFDWDQDGDVDLADYQGYQLFHEEWW